MIIDRVVVNSDGELAVLDLKSGSRSPASDLQLAVYAAGMERVLGVRPKYGMYWMARDGVTTALADLDHLSTERILAMIGQFDRARKAQIFLPNLKECHYCGVAQHCEWSKK
jgi:RecB family exonuclease